MKAVQKEYSTKNNTKTLVHQKDQNEGFKKLFNSTKCHRHGARLDGKKFIGDYTAGISMNRQGNEIRLKTGEILKMMNIHCWFKMFDS